MKSPSLTQIRHRYQTIRASLGQRLLSRELSDPVTGLPTVQACTPSLCELTEDGRHLYVISFDLMGFTEFERIYGNDVCDDVLRSVSKTLHSPPQRFLRDCQLVCACAVGGDDFVCFVTSDENYWTKLSILASALRHELERRVERTLARHMVPHSIGIHVGWAEVSATFGRRLDSAIYGAIKEATALAKNKDTEQQRLRRVELEQIIANRSIHTVFQPIVHLDSGKVFAYEALSRGPRGSFFENPLILFEFAAKMGLLFNLERLCRELAISNVFKLSPGQKLFINVDPQVIHDPMFRSGTTLALLESSGLDPQDIVLELTKRSAIDDFQSFQSALEYYHTQGYNIAIDDAGSGYSSLRSIAELRPPFIKLDMSLIRDIDTCPAKQALIDTFVRFASRINARLVAEGIETEDELHTVIALGVDLGQGYFLAKPESELPLVNATAIRFIEHHQGANRRKKNGMGICDIAKMIPEVDPAIPVEEVIHIFEQDPTLGGIVVTKDTIPRGLVMREKLFSRLGTRFGYSLYARKPIQSIMDRQPLVVSDNTPIETVSRLATARSQDRMYDYVIVSLNDSFLGIASIQDILGRITDLQIQVARSSNPLTGLPGNQQIREETEAMLASAEIFALLYIDIDNFKSYNDCYGFERGDQAIKFFASTIQTAVNSLDPRLGFVGHIGGDDFIAICDTEQAEHVAREIITSFDRMVPGLYSPSDAERKCVLTHNRQEHECQVPLMTVSIAVITNQYRSFASYLEISQEAAELKTAVKRLLGSHYLVDRRRSN